MCLRHSLPTQSFSDRLGRGSQVASSDPVLWPLPLRPRSTSDPYGYCWTEVAIAFTFAISQPAGMKKKVEFIASFVEGMTQWWVYFNSSHSLLGQIDTWPHLVAREAGNCSFLLGGWQCAKLKRFRETFRNLPQYNYNFI